MGQHQLLQFPTMQAILIHVPHYLSSVSHLSKQVSCQTLKFAFTLLLFLLQFLISTLGFLHQYKLFVYSVNVLKEKRKALVPVRKFLLS